MRRYVSVAKWECLSQLPNEQVYLNHHKKMYVSTAKREVSPAIKWENCIHSNLITGKNKKYKKSGTKVNSNENKK